MHGYPSQRFTVLLAKIRKNSLVWDCKECLKPGYIANAKESMLCPDPDDFNCAYNSKNNVRYVLYGKE
jgi:hypothetical protein